MSNKEKKKIIIWNLVWMDFIAHQKGVRWIQIEGNSHNKYKIDEEGFEVEFKSSFCS
jgi:hypothetical protein